MKQTKYSILLAIFFTELIVKNNSMNVFYPFTDGYTNISKSKFLKFQFIYNKNQLVIKNPVGYKYIKITDDVENHFKIMSNYIGKIIMTIIYHLSGLMMSRVR